MSIKYLCEGRDRKLTSLAVKVSDTKNVNITAVFAAGAADNCLSLADFGGRHSHGASKEAEESDE